MEQEVASVVLGEEGVGSGIVTPYGTGGGS